MNSKAVHILNRYAFY